MESPRYIVGIDLGTTNSCVFYVDTAISTAIHPFLISQATARGTLEKRELLPSFCLLEKEETIVGEFAKEEGAKTPTRLVHSAKSWLCNASSARRDKILPLVADSRRLSPVEATSAYLRHILMAWNKEMKEPLEEQEVVLTVPASFDEVARVLTVEAAKMAGFKKLTLLEEPQAAFYSWILSHESTWKQMVQEKEIILVVDVGGGTTDFSLIEVGKDSFQRMQVGNHLLLGGDNMDEAIAHLIEPKLVTEWRQLVFAARKAKEVLLGHGAPATYTIVLQGTGSRVVGGSQRCELSQEELREFLSNGFFKVEPLQEALKVKKKSGLISMGLAYEAEPSVLKHLACFLQDRKPTKVLFNGGSMKPKLFREAVLRSIALWFGGDEPQELTTFSLDTAVARGACYFGRVKQGLGVKIGGGLPRAYYLQLPDNKALTLLARGTEEGFTYKSSQEFLAEVGVACKFQILTSNTRLHDHAPDIVECKEEEMAFLPTIQTVLRYGKQQGRIPVHLCVNFTHIGTIELWLETLDASHKWMLEFQLSCDEKRRVDETYEAGSLEPLLALLQDRNTGMSHLEKELGLPRAKWPPSVLRSVFDALIKLPDRSARFWNIAGFCLRPGFGYPLDDYRMKELWKIILAEKKITEQHLVAYRRVAGGLSKGQQTQLAALISPLESKNPSEYAEKVRCLASFELVDMQQKIRMGAGLIKKIRQKAEAWDVWALGRLGARQLIVGSFIHVIPVDVCMEWLDALIPISFDRKSVLFEQLARKVDVRELQLPQDFIVKLLPYVKNPTLLTEVVPYHQEEQETLLGDNLPPGLTIK